jgi:MoaA/NifB/PqqE/SkfB family radical SAM enzyme
MNAPLSPTPDRARHVGSRAHAVLNLPVVVIALHEACNCRCVMCDIWKIQSPRELQLEHLERQLDSFEKLGVRSVALTGGEPERHRHFAEFARALRARGIRVSLLTAGVLLESEAKVIAEAVNEVIVSLDGPPELHDRIRRVPEAFHKLALGVRALSEIQPAIPLRGRCTVQRANHSVLCRTVECAKEIGLTSLSFLAADLSSPAFNRPITWSPARQNAVALDKAQVECLEDEIECLIATHGSGGFVRESPEKLRRIVSHFRAHLGQVPAIAPRCNAPWVSAVIEAGGEVRPCFFHPPLGSIHQMSFAEVINSPEALEFRAHLDIASNPTCRRCVCSLFLPPDAEAPLGRPLPSVNSNNLTPSSALDLQFKGRHL